jgi:hypothetical protein
MMCTVGAALQCSVKKLVSSVCSNAMCCKAVYACKCLLCVASRIAVVVVLIFGACALCCGIPVNLSVATLCMLC